MVNSLMKAVCGLLIIDFPISLYCINARLQGINTLCGFRRFHSRLPEVREQRKEEKRRSECAANRERARQFQEARLTFLNSPLVCNNY